MARQPHVMVIPHAAQGHVAPLMKLSLQIAAHGVKVTFVNTEFIHEKVKASLPAKAEQQSLINLVSIPDGLEPEDDRQDFVKLTESMLRVMPGHLRNLIENINRSNVTEQITWVIADMAAGWALEVAKKMGIKRAAVLLSSPASMALALHVPRLIEAGIIDTDGTLIKDEPITLSEDIPAWNSSELSWSCCDPVLQKLLFAYICTALRTCKFADQILCNTFYELDSSAMKLIPKIIPIGPFIACNNFEAFSGNFWPEDSTCLSWLDKQTPGSVIYVALGSTTILSPQQVDELALGLELTGLPFLWVVRSNLTDGSTVKFPEGFINRVAGRGKIVGWAPQEKVLAHRSIACFLSHCGWNSTLEGLSTGIPFLCWPYFADQFHNRSYICDLWKIGLALAKDENGIITRNEMSTKIKILLSSDGIKANALHLKEVARKSVSERGSSFKNFKSFIEQI
ncbi:PREDICTED: UDP-glycosyltransferase 83A1 [Theobroma cacao]|uniref:UDP-glycosyltransferase 83A1 n=2 Tax=Theobroma cacao TaxID=3641 RepID=A0AB32VDX2_THECC|nr:PREDICTED: UDP-glycosyltransferase 83A1 [Theobroma cacao]EOY22025.1 UDP-Glycosyltransferase superfamily protein isoform 1 [Theobroma cacao]